MSATAMQRLTTHSRISSRWCGSLQRLEDGLAEVVLDTVADMAVDERGLVHGGFVFGAADFAAMAAVNDPLVVLGAAETRFVAPVSVGERVTATATVSAQRGRKHSVEVVCRVGDRDVMVGTFTAFVLDQHVLDPR